MLVQPRLVFLLLASTTSSHASHSFRTTGARPWPVDSLRLHDCADLSHAVHHRIALPLRCRPEDDESHAWPSSPSLRFLRDPARRASDDSHSAIMDINSLLSPQDSPARETPPPHPAVASPSLQSPGKRTKRQIPSRSASGLSQQISSSPQPPYHAQIHPQTAYQQLPSPGVASFTNGARSVHSAMSTPTAERPLHSPHDARITPPQPLHRNTSTPSMDTLAGM